MRILEAGDWSLVLPDEWYAEREDDSILISDRDGVGCLEISELRRRPEDGPADLEALLDSELSWREVACGNLRGREASFMEDGEALREWCLASGDLVLYVTYSCETANRGMDDAAVDEILDTLRHVAAE